MEKRLTEKDLLELMMKNPKSKQVIEDEKWLAMQSKAFKERFHEALKKEITKQ